MGERNDRISDQARSVGSSIRDLRNFVGVRRSTRAPTIAPTSFEA